jgi:nucleoside-diphosphate kinase
MERTYIMVKPDGVQRGLVGEIIKRFEQKGFKLVRRRSARSLYSCIY